MKRILVASFLAALVALPQGACGSDDDPAAGPVDKVTYLTAVGSFGRESYVWVAKEKGFFAAANIDVRIQPGSGTSENLGVIAAGKAQFAASDLSALMVVLGSGRFRADVRAVAAIQQRTLNSVTALSGSGVKAPRDLEGRTVAGVVGGAPWLLFPAYAKLAGVDASKVRWVPADAPQLVPLLVAGKVDCVGQFVVARPSLEKAADGRAAVVLPYSDVLTDLYGNALVASTRLLREDPDLVRRFSDALLAGLVYAIDHPQEAGQILHKHVPVQDPDNAAAELTLMAPYVRSGGVAGVLDPAQVARAIAILNGTGIVTGPLGPDDVVQFDAVTRGVQ